MIHPTSIIVDAKQFIKNIVEIKSHILSTSSHKTSPLFLLPVKANGYGHGLELIAAIAENHVDYFGVSCLSEGIVLRNCGIKKPIIVFGPVDIAAINELINYNLEMSVASIYKAKIIAETARTKPKIHIKIDTGMNRIGVRPESFYELLEYVEDCCFELKGIYSHLAMSFPDDEVNHKQINQFTQLANYVKQRHNILCHIANSTGVCYYKNSIFDMVRPGILSYGYFPDKPIDIDIKSCFQLKSTVTYFKVVQANSGISYNHMYNTKTITRIITVAIGYGDGYRRSLSGVSKVLLRNKYYPVVGVINMDMLMIDIGQDTGYVGDEVILIDENHKEISVTITASHLNTNIYEVLVGFTDRIPRYLC